MDDHNLRNILRGLHFSESEIDEQLKQLGQLILVKSFAALLKSQPPTEPFDSLDEALAYLKANMSDEVSAKIVDERVEMVVKDYLRAVGAL